MSDRVQRKLREMCICIGTRANYNREHILLFECPRIFDRSPKKVPLSMLNVVDGLREYLENGIVFIEKIMGVGLHFFSLVMTVKMAWANC